MKYAYPLTAAAAFLLGAITVACAQESELEKLRDKVTAFLPEIKREDVRPTAAPGLYEIQQGALFGYITADGKYLITGDMTNIESGVSVTEERRKGYRLDRLKALGEDKMIVFAPEKAEDIKHTVTIFTDIDCGYCRKLHKEIGDYNAAGISVQYVFYPRTGPETESFKKAEAVWCSSDRKMALTKAKQGAPLTGNPTCENPIQEEWQMGMEMGLRGTPMIVLPDGDVVNGYVPAQVLAERLAAPPQDPNQAPAAPPQG